MGEELEQAAGELFLIVVAGEKTVFAVDDEFRSSTDSSGDDGQAAGHGFEEGDRYPFGEGRQGEHIHGLEKGWDIASKPREVDRFFYPHGMT